MKHTTRIVVAAGMAAGMAFAAAPLALAGDASAAPLEFEDLAPLNTVTSSRHNVVCPAGTTVVVTSVAATRGGPGDSIVHATVNAANGFTQEGVFAGAATRVLTHRAWQGSHRHAQAAIVQAGSGGIINQIGTLCNH